MMNCVITVFFNLSRNIVALLLYYCVSDQQLSRNKIQCCELRQHVAQSRLELHFLQQILVLLLVLPLSEATTCLATNLNSTLVIGRREALQIREVKVAEHSFQEPMPNSP